MAGKSFTVQEVHRYIRFTGALLLLLLFEQSTMAAGDTRANKRKFGSGRGSPYAAAPRKGPPAIFVTCESGREKRCQREALELMHHYYYLSRQTQDGTHDTTIKQNDQTVSDTHLDANGDVDAADEVNNKEQKQDQEEKQLSLEEELSLLRKGAMAEEVLTYERNSKRQKGDASMKSPFSAYESGVRGMICILCNLPGSEVIPYDDIVAKIHAARKEKAENDASTAAKVSSEEKAVCENKEIVNEEDKNKKTETEKKHSLSEATLWDPVDTVKRIMEEVAEEKDTANASKALSSPPSSRFISRMLPMQATCYASIDEITLVIKSLLQTYLPPIIQEYKPADAAGTITFKIDIKRRLCSHLTRDQVIEAITPILLGSDSKEEDPEQKYGCKFSVKLSDPDFAIRIEVIKTLCGISILPRQEWYRNFNVAELIDAKEDK